MKAYFALVTHVYPPYTMARVSRKVFWHEYDKNRTLTIFDMSYWKHALHDLCILATCRVFPNTVTYNTEGKRVSNALYAPCKMFSESHARNSNIDQWERAIQIVNYGRGLECTQREHDSDWKCYQITIQNECSSRIYHNKRLYSSQSGEISSVELLGLVTCTRQEVTLLSEDILHGVYSTLNTLLPSHIMNSWYYVVISRPFFYLVCQSLQKKNPMWRIFSTLVTFLHSIC